MSSSNTDHVNVANHPAVRNVRIMVCLGCGYIINSSFISSRGPITVWRLGYSVEVHVSGKACRNQLEIVSREPIGGKFWRTCYLDAKLAVVFNRWFLQWMTIFCRLLDVVTWCYNCHECLPWLRVPRKPPGSGEEEIRVDQLLTSLWRYARLKAWNLPEDDLCNERNIQKDPETTGSCLDDRWRRREPRPANSQLMAKTSAEINLYKWPQHRDETTRSFGRSSNASAANPSKGLQQYNGRDYLDGHEEVNASIQ